MTKSKATVQATTPNMVRTSAGLRDAIFDELDALRQGTTNSTKANAVAKLAMTVVETVRMEIEVARHADALRKGRSGGATLGITLPLGG